VRHRFSASLPNRRWSLTLVSGTSAVSRSAPIWALLGWWPEPGAAPAARRPAGGLVGQLQHPRQRRDDRAGCGAGRDC